jgi:hypothetical protein
MSFRIEIVVHAKTRFFETARILGLTTMSKAEQQTGGRLGVPEWLIFLLIFAGYLVLMRWVLPAAGVQT